MSPVLNAAAFALRPVRVDVRNNRFINFKAITFPANPREGCELYLRRASMFGLIEDGEGLLNIDVLSHDGDILQTFAITQPGFEYLRQKLRFRRETAERSL